VGSSSRPEILAAFRDRKVRCTPQRYIVLDYLNRNPKHPTAEEIYKAINRADPRASLAKAGRTGGGRALRHSYTEICNMTFGKDHRTYDMALAIPHEEVEHEAWFSEYLSEGPSGHFRRGNPEPRPTCVAS
jgi:hypothetical protein